VPPPPASRDLYLSLLKRSLLGSTVAPVTLLEPATVPMSRPRRWLLDRLLRGRDVVLARGVRYDLATNGDGTASVWQLPPWSLTMIGERRLDNVEACLLDVLAHEVAGDLIEAGVWKGGTTIFMRGVLRAHGVEDRAVYVADSFEGLPTPDADRYPADEGLELHLWEPLAVNREEVAANFERYGLLDDRVRFVEGWFKDTLPALHDRTWALIRLDGDYYESTMDALTHLYPNLAPGGWVIVDDHEIPACAQAVADYRERHGIDEPIETVDWTGICWRKRPRG
jgi:hypothetical protein